MNEDYIKQCVEWAEKDILDREYDDFCALHEERHLDCIVKSIAEYRTRLDDNPPRKRWWHFWKKEYHY